MTLPVPAAMFIKPDDERLGQRYIEPRYPQAPAGAIPHAAGASDEWR
jgi:hypothetical protein